MSAQWFAGISKPSKEVLAAVAVAAKGYPVFLPVSLVTRTVGGIRKQVSRPLFPRYLFVQFDRDTDDYSRIYYARGIAHTLQRKGLICDAMDRPSPIPDKVIDDIREHERVEKANAGLVRTGYRPGDKFLYRVGPYAEIEVTYMGEDAGEVTITFSMFGQMFMRQIPFETVPAPCVFFDANAA